MNQFKFKTTNYPNVCIKCGTGTFYPQVCLDCQDEIYYEKLKSHSSPKVQTK